MAPSGNKMLDCLVKAAGRRRVETRLAKLPIGQVLTTPREPISHVVFPTTCVCSILVALKSGHRAEVGTIGNEGFVGIPAFAHLAATDYAIVQIAGDAHVMPAADFQSLLQRHEECFRLVLRYAIYAYQVAQQTTVCNSYHSVEQRLARWLLIAHDRAQMERFPMTHELLGHMVAATRPRVSEAASRLKATGVITYDRGVVRVVNRRGLEAKTCECYAATELPTELQR
jgi:CRP-like cAMP-binding protein